MLGSLYGRASIGYAADLDIEDGASGSTGPVGRRGANNIVAVNTVLLALDAGDAPIRAPRRLAVCQLRGNIGRFMCRHITSNTLASSYVKGTKK